MSEERKEKSDQFAMVYHDVLHDPLISDSAAIIYGMLLSKCYQDTSTFVTNKKLCVDSGKSDTAVRNAMKVLKDNGYIVVTGSNNSRLIYPKHLTPDLSNVVQTPNNRVFTEKQHRYMEACILNWGARVKVGEFERVAGAQHKMKPLGVGQSKTVWRIHQYLKDASKGNLDFYDMYIDKVTTSWAEKTGITREKVAKSTQTLKDVLKTHLDLLKAGTEKEGFRLLPNSLEHFFIQTQKTPENKAIVSSWFLYWLCKDQIVEEQKAKQIKDIKPIQRKYPDQHGTIYRKIDELFKVNRKKLEKTTTELQNQCLLLSEAVIEEIKIKKKSAPKSLASLSIPTLTEHLEEFIKSLEYMGDNLTPAALLPGRRSWNNMIGFLADKVDPCYKARYKFLEHTVNTP